MRNTILISLTCLLVSFNLNGQIADGKIRIEDISAKEISGEMSISYNVVVDKRAVKRNNTLVFAPIITDGVYRQSLPPVVVQGKGSKTSLRRQEWRTGQKFEYADSYQMKNGEKLYVSTTVPAQLWMQDASVVAESVVGGCCNYTKQNDVLVANELFPTTAPAAEVVDLVYVPVSVPAPEVDTEYVLVIEELEDWVPETVADTLSMVFNFVVPLTEFDEDEPFKVYDDERENFIIIYFRQGKHFIDPTYLTNEQTLNNLTSAISMILSADDSNVKQIVVAGFASPEGDAQMNDYYAFERALAVKKYIAQETGLEDHQVLAYNGSVDWLGLRGMVARSDMLEKYEVIDIIDNTPIWDSQRQVGRHGELMRLNGGRTYNYMKDEYFPYMRNGAFIKVYYENN